MKMHHQRFLLMFAIGAFVAALTFRVLIELFPSESEPDLEIDYIYDPETTVDTSGVVIQFLPPTSDAILTLTHDGKMELGSPPIAIVDLETGRVFLYGDPDEAARMFWEAVELMKP